MRAGTNRFAVVSCTLLVFGALCTATEKPGARRTGIQTPGIQIPFTSLKAEAEIALPGAVTGAVFGNPAVVAVQKGALVRLDLKANKTEEPAIDGVNPCSVAVSAFGGVWVGDCESGKLAKFDTKAKKLNDGVPVAVVPGAATLAASTDSLWVISDGKTTLSRIDPEKNSVVAEIRLPAGCSAIAYGESALWAACPTEDRVLRIHPLTNLVEQRIEISGSPAAVAVGEGSVWALSERDGKLSRIDPKTNKVTTTIELKAAAEGASIATGEGAVWVSAPGFPLTRIDPATDKVMQQFAGDGNGLLFVGGGSVWLAARDAKAIRRYDPKRIRATLPE